MRCVHGVSPFARGIKAELAVTTGTRHIVLNNHGGGTVHIRDDEVSAHGLCQVGFDQRAGADTTQD